MAGALKTHPYYKSWDELQRSIKRMENYITINGNLLDQKELTAIQFMIHHMKEAIERVPEDYRLTKHRYQNK
jgi:hypothetical protein